MTDKELIKQEIERRIEKYGPDFKTPYNAMYQLLTLLDFIDSIPEEYASEDLENELNKYVLSNFTIDKETLDRFGIKPEDYTFSLDKRDLMAIASYFVEWQRKKDQETIELAEDHAMLAGMMKEREEMIKDAINAEVLTNFDYRYLLPEVSTSIFDSFKTGDKVKLIVIREGQQ